MKALVLLVGIVTGVHDGDSIQVGAQPVRLAAVAAPELKEPGGIQARDALRALALGQLVVCIPTGKTSYTRIVATCRLADSGVDVGRAMIEQRLARPCPAYGHQYDELDHQDVPRASYCEARK